MINVKLRHKGSKRNKIILICLGSVFAFAIVVFTWFGVQNSQYRSQFATYRQEVSEVVAAAPDAFKQFKEAADVNAQAAALDALSATVSQKIKAAPVAPNILGFSLGTDGERSKQNKIVAAGDAFAAKLKEESAFITYQSLIAHNLQALSLKSAGNYDQIVALAAEWQRSIEYVKQTTAPTKLNDVSASLLQKMASTHAVILQLADLYKAKDEAGFAAKEKELTAAIAAFKPLAEHITQAAAALDTELAQTYAVLRQNL